MKTYARIQSGIVLEIIEPFERLEIDRPPAPAPLPEGHTPDAWETEQRAIAQAAHDGYTAGEVPVAERFHPDFVAQLIEIPTGTVVVQGDSYSGGQFGPPIAPVIPPVTTAQALAERDSLLAIATMRIAPLQDAVDLDEATSAEVALLKKWKQYRVALNRVQDQAEFPTNVQWPAVPA